MKNRKEVVKFVEMQLMNNHYEPSHNKHGQHHYGRQELRDLMDFIYDSMPGSKEEEVGV